MKTRVADIRDLVGLSMKNVRNFGDELWFDSLDGRQFKLHHDQTCCESVSIEDVCGDLSDLVGPPILIAEENRNSCEHPPGMERVADSFTWTFYKFATIKGYVDIRWYGSSSGFYSEAVSFSEVMP